MIPALLILVVVTNVGIVIGLGKLIGVLRELVGLGDVVTDEVVGLSSLAKLVVTELKALGSGVAAFKPMARLLKDTS